MKTLGIDIGSTTAKLVLREGEKVLYEKYERHFSQVRQKTLDMLAAMPCVAPNEELTVAISGSAGLGLAQSANLAFVQEVFATGEAVKLLAPDTSAVIELGGAYPWLIFITTSLLSIVLYPSGTACWLYLIFFGYYPIVKEKIERLPKAVAWILKLALFNVSVLAYVAIAYFLFFGGANAGSLKDAFTSVVGGADAGFTLAIALYAVLNLVFILYDVAMTRIISFYFIKLRHRLKLFK